MKEKVVKYDFKNKELLSFVVKKRKSAGLRFSSLPKICHVSL